MIFSIFTTLLPKINCLSVFAQGHEKEALNLMSTYLPKDSSPGSAYSEGGGLYALGELTCPIYVHCMVTLGTLFSCGTGRYDLIV